MSPTNLTDMFVSSYFKNTVSFDRFIRKQTLENGSTGNVAFDENGDRTNAEYDIINVQNQTQISVGQYHYSNVCIQNNFLNLIYLCVCVCKMF